MEADIGDGGRTKKNGTGGTGSSQHLLVERRAVKLVGRHAGEVAGTDLSGLIERFDFLVLKPEPQALLGQMKFV